MSPLACVTRSGDAADLWMIYGRSLSSFNTPPNPLYPHPERGSVRENMSAAISVLMVKEECDAKEVVGKEKTLVTLYDKGT